MKTKILLALMLMLMIHFIGVAQIFDKQGAGVTVIVHGWNPDGSQPAWMQEMANAIIARSGGTGSIGTIAVTGTVGNLTAACTNWNFDLATATSGEIVILVNWTAVSNHLTTGVTAQSVAAVVAPKIYQSQNSQPALSELPIHLIGHSRGGGMVFEIARLLGLQGVEVEQVTSLDPHPLNASDPQGLAAPFGPGQTIDTPIQVYENILFADNYYQTIQYPMGAYLNGAYNRLWTSLPGGYHNETGYTYNILGTGYNFSDHLNIILAYHGTIDLATPVTNGQATITATERAWFNTYENSGANSGFYYSRNIYGDRKSTNTPVTAADQVIDGYHNNPNLGGDGARQSLTWTSAVWPNIILIEASDGTNLLVPGNTYEIGDLSQITFQLPVRSYASGGVINIYLDDDRNPYNGKVFQANTTYSPTGSSIIVGNPYFQPTQLMDKNYYALIEITGGTNTRYIYAPYQFYRTCVVNIPDANFKAALVADANINTNGDGEIQCSEADAFTADIHAYSSGNDIADMTGIEAFTNATELYCGGNSFTTLDLSSNTALQRLYCGGNSLTTLNLSSNTALVYLECNDGLLTSLNVSGLTSLTEIHCHNNQFATLDFTTNTGLQYLNCYNNLLTSLNVSGLTSLTEINCYDNQFSALNVSTNTSLASLNCYNNSIINLDLSANTALTTLSCYSNQLTTLNVTGLSLLAYIDCSYNQFSTLNFSGLGLTSLSEIYCNENLLTTLNISGLTALSFLDCSFNQISSLDCSTNNALEYLYCSNNAIANLNVSGLTNLIEIYCHYNQLADLNVSGLTSLTYLDCYNNLLTSINLDGLTNLSYIDCSYNQFSTLNFSGLGLTSLEYIYCNANLLTSLNVSGLTSLIEIDCYENQLTSLDFSINTAIQYLYCRDNLLTSLNVKNGNNTNMSDFIATNNPGLTCIQVDDATYSTTNWTNIDATASFNTNCGYSINTISATVNPINSGTILGAGDYNADETVTLTATANTGYTFVNWTENGTEVSTNTAYSFTATANRTLVANFVLSTDISSLSNASQIAIYPNPNNGTFQVNINIQENENSVIKIYNSLGQEVRGNVINNFQGEYNQTFDLSMFVKGVYLVKINLGENQYSHKVIVE